MLKKIDKRLNRQKVQRNEDAALLPNEEDGGGATLTWWIWWPIDGWTHMKTQSGEKVYKCNQCDFASVGADNLRKHLKTPSGENCSNAINATLHLDSQGIWRHIWKLTFKKKSTNATNVPLHQKFTH